MSPVYTRGSGVVVECIQGNLKKITDDDSRANMPIFVNFVLNRGSGVVASRDSITDVLRISVVETEESFNGDSEFSIY